MIMFSDKRFPASRAWAALTLATALLPLAAPIIAAPNLWTFQDVVFNDGATATNSFFHDSAIGIDGSFFLTSPAPFVVINPFLSPIQQIPDAYIIVGPAPNLGSIVYSAPALHPTVTHLVEVLSPTEVKFTYDYLGTPLGMLHLSFSSLLDSPFGEPGKAIAVSGFENRYSLTGESYTHTIVHGFITTETIQPRSLNKWSTVAINAPDLLKMASTLGTESLITSAIPEPEIYATLSLGLAVLGWVGLRKKRQVV